MPLNRLWLGNPGCPDEDCCPGGDTNCGDLCIDMTQGNPGSETPGSGISLNGGTLGTEVTDSNGRACFSGIIPGTYSFVASKTGYITNTFDVEVTAEDCDGTSIIKSGGVLLPTTPGTDCKDAFLWQCRWCPRPGITLTFNGPGFTQTVTTQFDGRFRLCIPSSYTDVITVTIPGDGGPQEDTVVSGNRSFWIPFFGTVRTISADRVPEWHCLPSPINHCMIPWMDQVIITFGPTWGSLAGTSHTLDYDPGGSLVGEAHYQKWYQDGAVWLLMGMAYQWEHSNECGNRSHSFGNISYHNAQGGQAFAIQQFNNQQSYGSVICPVNGKYNLIVNGVADPNQYFIATE